MKHTTHKLRTGLIVCRNGSGLTSVRWSQDGKRWALTKKAFRHLGSPEHLDGLQLCHDVHVKRQRRNGRLYGAKFSWRKAEAGPPRDDWPDEAKAMLALAHLHNWHLDFKHPPSPYRKDALRLNPEI